MTSQALQVTEMKTHLFTLFTFRAFLAVATSTSLQRFVISVV